jgi:hypothetical protein
VIGLKPTTKNNFMPATNIRGSQILNATVQRQDLDTSTVGQAVVTKLIQGSNISLSSTGADAGTGDVTISHPIAVSSDAGNIATLGSDNLILVPQSTLWSTRLRSFNAIGNPNFEVDQRNVGTTTSPGSTVFALDRWFVVKSGTMVLSTQQSSAGITPIVPGTSFYISSRSLLLTLTTQETSLAAGDYLGIQQVIEGPNYREMAGDVTSISLLISTNVFPLKFAVSLRDSPATQSLVKLCTISSSGYTLIQLPNIPVMPVSGSNFSRNPGSAGYVLTICFACGSTLTAPSLDVWNAGNFIGAPGMDNFAGKPITTSTINIGFVQHEPGAVCTTLIDKPFTQNYDECLRYYQKSYNYTAAAGTASANVGQLQWFQPNVTTCLIPIRFIKPMAKVPTVIGYSPSSGAANSIRDVTGATDRSISSYNSVGDSGFSGVVLASAPVANAQIQVHYTADAGW